MNVISGVPQGSILGPLLFIMYINDLVDITKLDLYLYADDAKVMNIIKNYQDCLLLQTEVDKIASWSTKWGLKFNEKKCNIVTFNRKRATINYKYLMNGSEIERSTSISDLGIKVDDK